PATTRTASPTRTSTAAATNTSSRSFSPDLRRRAGPLMGGRGQHPEQTGCWPKDRSAHEVVAAHGLAAVRLGALCRLLQQPVHVFVEGGERVSGGIATRLLEDALRLACDDERFQRPLGHLWLRVEVVSSDCGSFTSATPVGK